jgi:hypothetical protein
MNLKVALSVLLVALLVAVAAGFCGSELPDGLEWVAEKIGFEDLAKGKPVFETLFPDYTIPVLGRSGLSTPLAGIIGTLLCFIIPFSLYIIRKK